MDVETGNGGVSCGCPWCGCLPTSTPLLLIIAFGSYKGMSVLFKGASTLEFGLVLSFNTSASVVQQSQSFLDFGAFSFLVLLFTAGGAVGVCCDELLLGTATGGLDFNGFHISYVLILLLNIVFRPYNHDIRILHNVSVQMISITTPFVVPSMEEVALQLSVSPYMIGMFILGLFKQVMTYDIHIHLCVSYGRKSLKIQDG